MTTDAEHWTPRTKPGDPAYSMLDRRVTKQKVHRKSCYICRDREFARLGMSLCNLCCACSSAGVPLGHIPADDDSCDDCGHELCSECLVVPAQEGICTCDTPCCEVDIGVGVMTCGGYHCPTHGHREEETSSGSIAS